MGLLACTWLPPNGQQQQQQLGPRTLRGQEAVDRQMLRVEEQKECLRTFCNISDTASYFIWWDFSGEFCPFRRYLYDALRVQDKKGLLLILLVGSPGHLTSCAIICARPVQVPRNVPLTEFCQFINPSCSRRMLLFSPWMIGPDRKSEPVMVKR